MYQNKIIILTTLLITVLSANLIAQHRDIILEEVIKIPGVVSDKQISLLSANQKSVVINYKDGLGRIIQTNAMGASPQHHDMIQANSYDLLGRQSKAYLPYTAENSDGNFRTNALSQQASFYSNGTGNKVADDVSPFKQAVFENSPLQRLLVSGGIGEGFQPGQHDKSIAYRLVTETDDVIQWGQDGIRHGSYAAGSLSVAELLDEQGNKTLIFTNNSGQQILKRQLANEMINGATHTYFDTYYVYNDVGLPVMIIPPKAISAMNSASNWDLEQLVVARLLFRFKYDNRARLIEKSVPGTGVVYIVYDPLSRPVFVQDIKLRAANQWNYIKYDIKGRAISQGIYTDEIHVGLNAMQIYVNELDVNNAQFYESRSTSMADGYYTNLVFPVINIQPLAYSYFDDYDLDGDGNPDYTYQVQSLADESIPSARIRGAITVVRKKILNTSEWLTKVSFYDKRGICIQVLSNNQLNPNLNDTKTLITDFTGKVLNTKTVKVVPSASTTILSAYTYDHSNRLLTIDDSYNGAPFTRIASYNYNELGQLMKKGLHALNSSGNSFLQSVDYRYNIRGQMISLNNSTLTADDKNDDSNDVFGMEMLYEQNYNAIGNTGYFNGQLSAVKWQTKNLQSGTSKERSYHFEYDKLMRLNNALYQERSSGGGWGNIGAFDEKNITYDENGNILSLQRNAYISGSITAMDNLQYSYEGNRLINLSDGGDSALGFKNLTGSVADYVHDNQGNLISDPKKGLNIIYNVLNKTERITITTSIGRYIDYTYDAFGVLLRKRQYDNNLLQKTTDYIEGFVYENNTLSYFPMAEGRVRNTGSGLKPEYMITDYQGNVRVSFEEQNGVASVRQENSYYPFGLIMPGGTVPTNPNNKLYNGGSEWQNDYADLPDYYNTYYRNYDPSIGRFISIDPIAEASSSITTYSYANNNPLIYNDPMGDIAITIEQAINEMSMSGSGGTWSSSGGGTLHLFKNDREAYNFGWDQLRGFNAMGDGGYTVEMVAGLYARKWAGTGRKNITVQVAQGEKAGKGFYINYSTNDDLSADIKGTGFISNESIKAMLDADPIGEVIDKANTGLGVFALGQGQLQFAYEATVVSETNATFSRMSNINKIRALGRSAGTLNGLQVVGRVANYAGVGIVIGKVAYNQEIKPSDILDGVIGAASFIPGGGWAIGGAYLIGDLATKSLTGESIGDHLNNYYGNKAIVSWK